MFTTLSTPLTTSLRTKYYSLDQRKTTETAPMNSLLFRERHDPEDGERKEMDLQDLVAGKPPPAAAAEVFYGLHQYQATAVVESGHDPVINQIMPAPAMQERVGVYEDVDLAAAAGGGGRWPRQETLTLLEVRTQLDSQFREAAQKGPLWEEVSRIMAEEHGYHRSGKKCREKLENLYKYYKKTKEGKAGRQDGKHYRFFRQLEALYGRKALPFTDTKPVYSNSLNLPSFPRGNRLTSLQHRSRSLSLSNSCESGESSASKDDEEEEHDQQKQQQRSPRPTRRGGKSRNWQMNEFLDAQLRRLMEVQESWMNKMLKTLERTEQERISKEEAWRQRETARSDRERSLWATERAWIEARDCAIIEALQKIGRKTSTLEGKSTLSEHDRTDLVKLENCDVIDRNFVDGKSTEDQVTLEEETSSGAIPCNGYKQLKCTSKCPYDYYNIMDDRPLMDSNKLRRCNYNHDDGHRDPASSQQQYRQSGEVIPSPSSYVINPSADRSNGPSLFLLMREGEELQWKQRGLDI